MQLIKHNPPDLFPQYRCHTHAVEIRGGSRLLFISGLNGVPILPIPRTMKPTYGCVPSTWVTMRHPQP